MTAAGKKQLNKKGKLRIKVRFIFTPKGGKPKTHVQTFAIKLPKKKPGKH